MTGAKQAYSPVSIHIIHWENWFTYSCGLPFLRTRWCKGMLLGDERLLFSVWFCKEAVSLRWNQTLDTGGLFHRPDFRSTVRRFACFSLYVTKWPAVWCFYKWSLSKNLCHQRQGCFCRSKWLEMCCFHGSCMRSDCCSLVWTEGSNTVWCWAWVLDLEQGLAEFFQKGSCRSILCFVC